MAFLGPLLAALAAASWWMLDRAALLPLTLRDRPWPFALVALAALALTALRARSSRGAPALCATIAIAAGFALLVHHRYGLAAPPPGVVLGTSLGDVELIDARSTPVPLASLRGRPTLIALYRGTW